MKCSMNRIKIQTTDWERILLIIHLTMDFHTDCGCEEPTELNHRKKQFKKNH